MRDIKKRVSRYKNYRFFLYQLTSRQVITPYKRSKLGFLWAFLEPLAFMIVLYGVFGLGLKGGKKMEVPFICYLIVGLSVTTFFNSVLTKSTSIIRTHSYLLNKIDVPKILIPLSNVIAGLFQHLIFLLIVFAILIFNKIYPNPQWLQLVFYSLALFFLMLGINILFAALGVLLPDLKSITGVLTKLIFYATPVFWVFDDLPRNFKKILKFNPLVYIVNGYREALLGSDIINLYTTYSIYFWVLVFLLLFIGVFVFQKTKPYFSDLL